MSGILAAFLSLSLFLSPLDLAKPRVDFVHRLFSFEGQFKSLGRIGQIMPVVENEKVSSFPTPKPDYVAGNNDEKKEKIDAFVTSSGQQVSVSQNAVDYSPAIAPCEDNCPPTPEPTSPPKEKCKARPACLDAVMACKMMEPAEGWCPAEPTPEPTVFPEAVVSPIPSIISLDPCDPNFHSERPCAMP